MAWQGCGNGVSSYRSLCRECCQAQREARRARDEARDAKEQKQQVQIGACLCHAHAMMSLMPGMFDKAYEDKRRAKEAEREAQEAAQRAEIQAAEEERRVSNDLQSNSSSKLFPSDSHCLLL